MPAPGVEVRRERQRPTPRPRLSSITGFIGLAARGPLNEPQRLDNWGQFESVFGGFADPFQLPAAVYGFFANGGLVCHVVRVADTITPPRRPETALWVARNADGVAVLEVEAANEGIWGNELSLVMTRSNQTMTLARLVAPAGAIDDIVRLDTSADLYARDPNGLGPGSDLVIIDAEDSQSRIRREVIAILDRARIQLNAPLGRALPAASQVTGFGLDLEIESGNRRERFESLSLDPHHTRYIADVVNGPSDEASYVAKMAAGHTILVRVVPMPIAQARPLRGVDVRSAAELAALPPGVVFPADLAGRIEHQTVPIGRLVLDGVMTAADRAQLLALSTDAAYRAALDLLFEASQTFQRQRDGRDPAGPFDVRFFTGYDGSGYFPNPDPRLHGYQGLAALEAIEEVGLIAIPDLGAIPSHDGDYVLGQRQMLEHCSRLGDRFAILDAPQEAGVSLDPVAALTPEYVESLAFDPAADNGALYFPWLRMAAADSHDPFRVVPPCGAVAGIFARTDALEGVHRAPANEPLEEVFELQHTLDDANQSVLNEAGINCLRAFPGRGIRVWGARTLSRDQAWRHVPVRRTLLTIKKEIRHRLRWAVFEPNTADLRAGIAASLNGYFAALFQSNVLAGASAEEAYFVKCDAETTPREAVERGEIIAEVGFAPLHPAEFIVATIKRTTEAIDIATADVDPALSLMPIGRLP